MSDFVKLSALVGDTFTVKEVKGFTYKKWDNDEKKMLTSDMWQDGFKKVYQVETDKGQLDMGPGQIGQLLEGSLYNGVADLNGKTFAVKSNGKTGMDIRYYLNPVKPTVKNEDTSEDVPLEDINIDDIPF